MSEQLKQELEADTDRLETETVAGSETIGKQEKDAVEGKLESQEGDESKSEAENAKLVKQKARKKLEAEKKKAILEMSNLPFSSRIADTFFCIYSSSSK